MTKETKDTKPFVLADERERTIVATQALRGLLEAGCFLGGDDYAVKTCLRAIYELVISEPALASGKGRVSQALLDRVERVLEDEERLQGVGDPSLALIGITGAVQLVSDAEARGRLKELSVSVVKAAMEKGLRVSEVARTTYLEVFGKE